MKILMLNGSPRPNGNTAAALAEMEKIFAAEGLETELVQVGGRDIRGCIACGKCIKVCPHNLIELVPASATYRVQCSSHVMGKDVRDACTAGCISCKICEKNCPSDAIHVVDNIAKIDYDKCTKCGICFSKCPRKIIKKY